MQSWTVGILCFNEAGTIADVHAKVKTVLTQLCDVFEIILVDDCSTDGSKKIIQDILLIDDETRGVFHDSNLGIGLSIRDIYFNARYENVVFVPGDGQFDVAELLPFASFEPNTFISFYRKENLSYSFFRNSLSYFNKLFNQIFIGLTLRDVNWVKVYKTNILRQLDLRSESSYIESEICAKLNKLKISAVEVESVYIPRVYGESKGASWKIIRKVYKELFKVFFIVKAFDPKKVIISK
jgi:glycosyltransferase involved in cell wall biosynthesis